MADSTYEKSFLTVDQQIDRIEQRGMVLGDRDAARNALRRIGYYRLSGYWHPYRVPAEPGEKRSSEFLPNTRLSDVLDLYTFDEHLRAALLEAIAQIEVALRFELGHRLGRHGPFAHLDESHFNAGFTKPRDRVCKLPGCDGDCRWEESDHHEWVDRQRQTEQVSTEAFAAHFREHYGEPLPIWVATEVMSFGKLTRLLDGLDSTERERLAAEWDVINSTGQGDPSALSNWMEHLRQVRNICAHHARIWNRNINATIAIPSGLPELQHLLLEVPRGDEYTPPMVRRVYGTFAILTHLLAVLDAPVRYRDRLRTLLTDFLAVRPQAEANMGFPTDWQAHRITAEDYRRDQQRAARLAMLKATEMFGSGEAADALTAVPEGKPRRSRVNYYRKNGALISVMWNARRAYPAFQFGSATGDVPELVILANRRLLDGGNVDEDGQWAALEWWLTPNISMPDETSPAEAMDRGTLTREALDRLLSPREDE